MSDGVALDEYTLEMCELLAEVEREWRVAAARARRPEAVTEVRSAFVERWSAPLRERLDHLFGAMTPLVERLPAEDLSSSRSLHHQLVQPFFMQSPFCRRATDKPLGYPGDYGLVEMIFRGREGTPGPLGSLLGNYALQVGPSEAHRGRLPWAVEELSALAAPGTLPRILSFACGPEVILRRWVEAGAEAEIVLADHDPAALQWAKRRILKARPRGNATTVTTVVANAFNLRGDLLEELGAGRPFDAVCVLGLLDYLDDAQIVRFLTAMSAVLRPDGRLLLSNLHATNPWRSLMELTADWVVAHRTVAGFEALVAEAGAYGDIRTRLHSTGTNLYCAATRT